MDGLREFFTATITGLVANQAMIDVLAGGSPSDADLQRCLAHLTKIGQEAVDRSQGDRTLARDVTADDIAYQLLGLIRIAQLLPDDEPAAIAHQVELALRALAAH